MAMSLGIKMGRETEGQRKISINEKTEGVGRGRGWLRIEVKEEERLVGIEGAA